MTKVRSGCLNGSSEVVLKIPLIERVGVLPESKRGLAGTQNEVFCQVRSGRLNEFSVALLWIPSIEVKAV